MECLHGRGRANRICAGRGFYTHPGRNRCSYGRAYSGGNGVIYTHVHADANLHPRSYYNTDAKSHSDANTNSHSHPHAGAGSGNRRRLASSR